MTPARNITDRAKRYRAQNAVTGPRKCVLCGSTKDLGVMHLTGNEDHGERANLAYGCRSCNGKLAAAFKRIGAGRPTNQYNPAKSGVPTFEQYMWAVSNHTREAHDAGGAVIHATPKHKRIEYARRIASGKPRSNPWPWSRPDARRTTPAHGGIAYHQGRSRKRADEGNAEFLKALKPKSKAKKPVGTSAMPDEAALQAGFKRGLSLADMLKANPAPLKKWGRDIVLYEGDSLETARQYLKRAISGSDYIGLQMFGKKGKWHVTADSVRKGNPATASAEAFEEFHGYGPSEVVKVSKERHYHKWVASAGDLVGLQVKPINGGAKRKIEGLGECFLAFNEAKNQLFVEGGDQEMSSAELKKFGIRDEHELQTLGKLVGIGYFTEKTHLGDEGGEAVYTHTFRSTNENGKHVIVKIARYPDLIYRVMDEQFELSGGSYEILREGINK
jgi:hypothetical protein